ncbi:MAG: hypothetical protein QNK05_00705 [Myxococcota bacterium]|nr:hypothetical protein [Myxococcota bacterium]
MQIMETTDGAGGSPGVDRRALIQGLGDGRWKVRLACLYGLYSEGSREGVEASTPLLRDLRASVRAMAVGIVSNGIRQGGVRSGHPDAVPLLIERIFQDESIKVRRSATLHLAWFHPHPDLEGLFQKLLDEERDAKLHQWAGIGLVRSRAAEVSS